MHIGLRMQRKKTFLLSRESSAEERKYSAVNERRRESNKHEMQKRLKKRMRQ